MFPRIHKNVHLYKKEEQIPKASISIICFLDKLLHAPPHIDTSPLLIETSLNHSERKNERQQNPEAYLEHLKTNERKVQQMQKNQLWFETILAEPTMSKRKQVQ